MSDGACAYFRAAFRFAERPLDSAEQVLLVIRVVPDVDSMAEGGRPILDDQPLGLHVIRYG